MANNFISGDLQREELNARTRRWRAERREIQRRDLVSFRDLRKVIPHLERNQLRYWVQNQYVEAEYQGHILLYFNKDSVIKIGLMATLCNKLGVTAKAAGKLANEFLDRGVLDKEKTYWLKVNGVTVGIPVKDLP